mmetsp:Transcript_14842/g.43988  ORF Transcript_14842/g.43988 Transcript_14842/m.43988 type:complete len:251 (+) Transcript_14842:139-891(+)
MWGCCHSSTLRTTCCKECDAASPSPGTFRARVRSCIREWWKPWHRSPVSCPRLLTPFGPLSLATKRKGAIQGRKRPKRRRGRLNNSLSLGGRSLPSVCSPFPSRESSRACSGSSAGLQTRWRGRARPREAWTGFAKCWMTPCDCTGPCRGPWRTLSESFNGVSSRRQRRNAGDLFCSPSLGTRWHVPLPYAYFRKLASAAWTPWSLLLRLTLQRHRVAAPVRPQTLLSRSRWTWKWKTAEARTARHPQRS